MTSRIWKADLRISAILSSAFSVIRDIMKYLCFMISMLAPALIAEAQYDFTTVTDKTIGWSNIRNKDITGKEISVLHTIHTTEFDSGKNRAIIRLHKLTRNGRLIDNTEFFIVYDLEKKEEMWVKDYDLRLSHLDQYNNYFLLVENHKSTSLNSETGKKLWSVKSIIIHVDSLKKIGLGFKTSSLGATNIFQGIDLTTQRILWERELRNKYGLIALYPLDSSAVIIVSEGLHQVRYTDGSGWDYNTITGERDVAEEIAAIAVVTVASVMSHTYMAHPRPDVISDVFSEVWRDSTGMYFASKELLTCLDFNGKTKWTASLPEEMTSKSHIIRKGDNVLMINTGYAYKYEKRIPYGKPFIAAYDFHTGRKLFFVNMSELDVQINSFKIVGNNIYLLFEDRFSKFNLSNGSLIAEKIFDTKNIKLINFAGKHVFAKNDSIYEPMALSDTTKHYLLMANNDILVLDNNMDSVKQIPHYEYYSCFLEENGYKYLFNGDLTLVINSKNEIIANLDICGSLTKIGSKLYAVLPKSLIEIDINDIR